MLPPDPSPREPRAPPAELRARSATPIPALATPPGAPQADHWHVGLQRHQLERPQEQPALHEEEGQRHDRVGPEHRAQGRRGAARPRRDRRCAGRRFGATRLRTARARWAGKTPNILLECHTCARTRKSLLHRAWPPNPCTPSACTGCRRPADQTRETQARMRKAGRTPRAPCGICASSLERSPMSSATGTANSKRGTIGTQTPPHHTSNGLTTVFSSLQYHEAARVTSGKQAWVGAGGRA